MPEIKQISLPPVSEDYEFLRRQGQERALHNPSNPEGSSCPIMAVGFPPREVSLIRSMRLGEDCPEWKLVNLPEKCVGSGKDPELSDQFPLSSQKSRKETPNKTPSGDSRGTQSKAPLSRFDQMNNQIEDAQEETGLTDLHFENEANIPGAAGVIRILGGNGFYCTVHKIIIQPIMYEVDGDEIPCCEECMLQDMVDEGREIKSPETIDPVHAAVGDHDIAEDVIWESMT
jgi:hypothetical protein